MSAAPVSAAALPPDTAICPAVAASMTTAPVKVLTELTPPPGEAQVPPSFKNSPLLPVQLVNSP